MLTQYPNSLYNINIDLGGNFMFDRVQLKLQAKQSLTGNWGVAIGTSIVGTLILSAASTATGGGGVLLSGVISVGLAIVMLEIVRGWKVEFTDMFKGFQNFGTTFLAGLLVVLYTFLWSLLFIIPGIIKMYSYSMTSYILADHPEMKPRDALEASSVMMDGHKMDLFVLDLSFIGWYLLIPLTLGIAAFYVGPYMSATRALFYEAIKDEKVAAPYTETEL